MRHAAGSSCLNDLIDLKVYEKLFLFSLFITLHCCTKMTSKYDTTLIHNYPLLLFMPPDDRVIDAICEFCCVTYTKFYFFHKTFFIRTVQANRYVVRSSSSSWCYIIRTTIYCIDRSHSCELIL